VVYATQFKENSWGTKKKGKEEGGKSVRLEPGRAIFSGVGVPRLDLTKAPAWAFHRVNSIR